MTRDEWRKELQYAAAIWKGDEAATSQATELAWFEFFERYSTQEMRAAVKRLALHQRWFPSLSELRKALSDARLDLPRAETMPQLHAPTEFAIQSREQTIAEISQKMARITAPVQKERPERETVGEHEWPDIAAAVEEVAQAQPTWESQVRHWAGRVRAGQLSLEEIPETSGFRHEVTRLLRETA